ncbi:SnoaL-like polyketide cyclase [Streptomyces sp. CC53]|uniref:ester cyclase n=1 Tax=unclassified Streptomyces TaxID=2593676 RepID=UPI0008DE6D9C|nr:MULTISPECIES: ester cyclase [unclassified Streptomyces]OII60982.1 SnoaL-like polyketide cyclase [Streptomyces sp. CC53]
MTFVQLIDCRTRQVDELNHVLDNWAEASRGKRTATHSIVGKDRADSTHVVEIVEFPSYEEAMRNSNLPETNRFYQEMVSLCEEEPQFTDLDVLRDEQLNKALVRDFFERVVNDQDFEAARQLCADGYREHDPNLSSDDLGLDQSIAENREVVEAFGGRITLDRVVAEGDLVCAGFTFRGSHVGEFQGMEPTGRDVSGTGHVTFRCENGKLAEGWWNWDALGLMEQIGALES